MDSKQLELILLKSKEIIEGQDLSFVLDLIVLKYLNDLFEVERKEIRQDFLLRGICEREVDGLIEEPAYYKTYFIPKVARWSKLSLNRLQHPYLELVKINHVNITVSCEEPKDPFIGKQIYTLIDMYDFGAGTVDQRSENINIIKQWVAKNNIKKCLINLLEN